MTWGTIASIFRGDARWQWNLRARHRCDRCAEISYDWLDMGIDSTKRKFFWLVFTVLSLLGWFLPFYWAILETFVALFASWWIVYRTDLI